MHRSLKTGIFIILFLTLVFFLVLSWYLESDLHGLKRITRQELESKILTSTPCENRKGEPLFGHLTINANPAPYDADQNCYYIPQSLSNMDLDGNIHWSNSLAKAYFVCDEAFQKRTAIGEGAVFPLYILLKDQYLVANICFTGLPALVLTSDEKAALLYADEARDCDGQFMTLFDPEGNNGYEVRSCGVASSPRGAQTLEYAKPQYRMDLISQDLEPLEISVLGLEKTETLLMSAQEYESTKIRDAVARDVWNSLCREEQSRGNYCTPSVRFCEVFEDDRYLGLYGLMERSPLDVNPFASQDALIKTKFLAPYSEVEKKLEKDPLSVLDWTYLNQYSGSREALVSLRNYVAALQSEPVGNLLDSYYLENIIAYFLYLNCVSAIDNQNTNCFFFQPGVDQRLNCFYRIPWDLDRTFGHPFGDIVDHDPVLKEQTIVSVEIEQILKADPSVWLTIQDRWFALRKTVFQEEAITTAMTDRMNCLLSSGAYERDRSVWGNPAGITELNVLLEYTKEHLLFLDDIFSQDTPEKLFEMRFIRDVM